MAKGVPVRQQQVSLDDLTLFYQPQMSADGTRIMAVEALLRVLRPRPRMMGPADVLRLYADDTSAEALDWWVLRRAMSDARNWPGIMVSINLSAGRFHDADFPQKVAELAAEMGVPTTRIEFELVESSYIQDFDRALANIQALRAHGFRIALDDFGTGYSSLTYLLRLPVDKVKIDKSFVDGLEFIQSAAIVHAVVALARALGLKITAEGVETEEQHRFLRVAGCHYMQGWLFSKAVAPESITTMLSCEGMQGRAIA